MKKSKLSGKDGILLLFLGILLIGVIYYLTFYSPLQKELTDLSNQSVDVNSQIEIASAKVASMNSMQAEVDEILSRPADQITEIAPYDNAKVVMTELNSILSRSLEYKLTFSDPRMEGNGTVRRAVSLSFTSDSYATAKDIISDLAGSHWRCLITNLSVNSNGNVSDGAVSVTASITFFESTNLS